MINKLKEELLEEKHLPWNFWTFINRIKIVHGRIKKNNINQWRLLENDKHDYMITYKCTR